MKEIKKGGGGSRPIFFKEVEEIDRKQQRKREREIQRYRERERELYMQAYKNSEKTAIE